MKVVVYAKKELKVFQKVDERLDLDIIGTSKSKELLKLLSGEIASDEILAVVLVCESKPDTFMKNAINNIDNAFLDFEVVLYGKQSKLFEALFENKKVTVIEVSDTGRLTVKYIEENILGSVLIKKDPYIEEEEEPITGVVTNNVKIDEEKHDYLTFESMIESLRTAFPEEAKAVETVSAKIEELTETISDIRDDKSIVMFTHSIDLDTSKMKVDDLRKFAQQMNEKYQEVHSKASSYTKRLKEGIVSIPELPDLSGTGYEEISTELKANTIAVRAGAKSVAIKISVDLQLAVKTLKELHDKSHRAQEMALEMQDITINNLNNSKSVIIGFDDPLKSRLIGVFGREGMGKTLTTLGVSHALNGNTIVIELDNLSPQLYTYGDVKDISELEEYVGGIAKYEFTNGIDHYKMENGLTDSELVGSILGKLSGFEFDKCVLIGCDGLTTIDTEIMKNITQLIYVTNSDPSNDMEGILNTYVHHKNIIAKRVFLTNISSELVNMNYAPSFIPRDFRVTMIPNFNSDFYKNNNENPFNSMKAMIRRYSV